MIKRLLAVLAVILIITIGVVAYSFLKTPEEASGPIEAVPITAGVDESSVADTSGAIAKEADTAVEANTVVEPEAQAEADVETDTVAEPETQAEAEAAADTDAAADSDAEATSAAETEAEALSAENVSSQEMTASPITFEIVPDESAARFYIDEVLRGAPKTVVGTTGQVAGQFAVNPNDLPATQVGIVQVNARTLATDNDFRNRAIKNQILLTDDYEFVTFTPKQVIGLPGTGAVGETYTFQIEGDLTVTDVTRQVPFDIVATAISETRIEGTAATAFLYTDFELFIPDAPAVDTVDDEVRLELQFVAEAVQ
jgi:polyisoprenoid-binding protein YceI